MKPVKIETSNITFVAEGCDDLPATRYSYENGSPGIETVWELDDEEKKQIMDTGRIYLYVNGTTIQPCFLAAESIVERVESD